MYTTKLVNKNVMADPAYITIGDPYKDRKENPFRESKKEDKPTAPFQTKMLPQNAQNGNFGKLEYSAGGYQECNKYTATQPLDSRKKGFGSKDAKRRDEFSNAIRTEQYRSVIAKETLVTQKGAESLQQTLSRILADRAATASSPTRSPMKNSNSSESFYNTSVPQFDIGRTRVTDFDPRSSKDTFYKFCSDTDKRLGDHRPMSNDFGDGAWDIVYKPPSHGGKSETKNFFDKSHLVASGL